MNRPNGSDFPVMKGTITIRNPRSVLLLVPLEFSLALALWLTSIVFTIWPEVLEHAPVSFEQRGVVHHVWHYALLLGSSLMLVGLLSAGTRRLQIELVGLVLVIGCLGVNLTAALASSATTIAGLGVGLRVAAILGLSIRAWIVVREPPLSLPTTESWEN